MIKIVFFGRLRELINIDQLKFELSSKEDVRVQDVIQNLSQQHQTFDNYIKEGNRLMIAVNQQISDVDEVLHPDDELAFFPPVTGG